MVIMYFKNPEFHKGINVTVRRGVRWDTCDDKDCVFLVDTNGHTYDEDGAINAIHTVQIKTKVMRFGDLRKDDLVNEHDPMCRDLDGLLGVMQEVYDQFRVVEIVTVVSFEIKDI